MCIRDREGDAVARLDLGHRAIAFVGARPQGNVEVERFDGYCAALWGTLTVTRSGLPEETQIVLLDLRSKEE